MPSEKKNLLKTNFVKWSLIFGGWTLVSLFFSVQAYFNYLYVGRPLGFFYILGSWLVCLYAWALLTPLVIGLGKRFPIERGKIRRNLVIQLFAGAMLSLLQLAIYVLFRQWFIGDARQPFSFAPSFEEQFVQGFHINLVYYWLVLGLTQFYIYYARFREREKRAAELEIVSAQLETQLAQAQLDALKMQIHPHFLFNTLNTISVFVEEDPAKANEMLFRLSDLLRIALKNTSTHEVTLKQELDFLSSYLEIEQTRFQDRLKVTIEADSETLDAKVPNLILQPLIENCIRHAVAPRETETIVEVIAERRNGHLRLIVRDDGEEEVKNLSNNESNGIGLANTRARLEKLYGENHRFEMVSAVTRLGDARGLQVTITIPFKIIDNK